jgi:predicted MPP superfamily phosphohydrolase
MAASKLKVQIVSDLHLEFRLKDDIKSLITPAASILILAGDIVVWGPKAELSAFHRLMKWPSNNYEFVFYTPGNHEFYSPNYKTRHTIEDALKMARDAVSAYKNVFFLYNQVKHVAMKNGEVYCIIGTTLWPYYNDLPANEIMEIYAKLTDFELIYVKDSKAPSGMRRIRPSDVSAMHKKARAFLTERINGCREDGRGRNTIVITHHKPTPHTNPRNASVINAGYEIDMTDLMKVPVLLWAHGHTHQYNDQRINGVRVYSNPLGYPGELQKFEKGSYILV